MVKRLDDKGREVVDSTPMAIPVGFQRPESLSETIRRLVRSEELRRLAERAGAETFEEADDFDVGDDFDPTSPYETQFDPGLGREVTKAEAEFINAKRREFDRALPPRQRRARSSEEEEPVKRARKGQDASDEASPKASRKLSKKASPEDDDE